MSCFLRRASIAVALALLCYTPSYAVEFDNDNGDGTWEQVTNWADDLLPDGNVAEIFLQDVNNPLPVVDGLPTVTLSSGNHSPTLLDLGGGGDDDLGDIQFLMTGGTLNLSQDSEIGNGSDSNLAMADYTAYFIQTGGDVIVTGGSGTDIKLSAGGDAIPMGSVYSIRGGSLQSSGTVDLGGGAPAAPVTHASALFEIVGTGPTSIEIEDLKTDTAADVGTPIALGFVLDAGGVTPLVARDDVQMDGLGLELGLSDVPPAGDIVLIQADRLSNDNQFIGLPDGSDVSADFGGNTYTWTINYFDSSDDTVIVDAVVLSNLRVSPAVPEPATVVLISVAGLLGLAVRRRAMAK
ncbi:PEP-CTERM sorting domain-containing protein [Aeoliella sp.]|uniref:PEP-CTERM sorting domain-containing protein n=1 Tax=Aeoliella sp. TaxID=2795800 RepID=UPI003CCBA17C